MSPTDYGALLDDLAVETGALDAVVAGLDAASATVLTPADGWDVRTTIDHLGGAEALAAIALDAPDTFSERLRARLDGAGPPRSWDEVLTRWRHGRARVLEELRSADARDRIPWIAGEMSAVSFATARLMETWAHGIDVADALGVDYPVTARLRHVADLGVRTRPFTYSVRGLVYPDVHVHVELVSPDGTETWNWNEQAAAAEVVRGDALDFCLVVTQRRHVADTSLEVAGRHAREWMSIAQCFAGPPTTARRT